MTSKRFSVMLLAALMLLMVVALPAQAQTAAWTASYYNNIYLTNPPVLDTSATQITFDWGSGSPANGVHKNNWSARFGTDVYFTAATYRFTVRADDEVRLWIDGQSVLNTFDAGQPGATLTLDVPLNGTHHIQIDYRERTGSAYLFVTWQDVRTVNITPTSTSTTPVTGITAVVTASVLNVRNAPSLSAPILTKIGQGQVYSVLGKSSDSLWYKLNVTGQEGWASAAYLIASNPGGLVVVDSSPVGINASDSNVVTPVRLNFRSGPATSFAALEVLPAGTLLKVVGRNADTSWLKVEYAGRQGWVALAFVRALSPLNFSIIPVVG